MPLLFVVLAIASVLFIEPAENSRRLAVAEAQASDSSALGSTLLVVRNALAAYMHSHPTASGSVPLSALGLPGWVRPDARIHALISGGRGFVYYTPQEPLGNLAALFGSTPSALVGLARDSRLESSVTEITTHLPASIPDRSVVLII